jgi:hypothetical protein
VSCLEAGDGSLSYEGAKKFAAHLHALLNAFLMSRARAAIAFQLPPSLHVLGVTGTGHFT